MESNLVSHWQNVYLTKDTTKVGWHQPRPQVSLDFIAKTKISTEDPIIDIGGGDGYLVDHLLEAGFQNLSMLDISEAALEKVKFRLAEKKDQVNFVVSNILDFNPKTKFHLWHDRAVFHFLIKKEDQEKYRKLVEEAVVPQGYLILATFSKSGPITDISE